MGEAGNANEVSPFDTMVLTEEQSVKVVEVRKAFVELHEKLNQIVPNGREKSIVMTNIEQACMWAIKGVSRG